MTLWALETCPRCEGSGFAYCERCERACEHDRACPRCGGAGEAPYRLEGFAALAAGLVGGRVWRTRRAALQSLER